jgi:hypothetical protein
MANASKVMNSITLVTKSIMQPGEKATDLAEGKNHIFRRSLQMLDNQSVSHSTKIPGVSGTFGTNLAVEQSALKTQITILERREQ